MGDRGRGLGHYDRPELMDRGFYHYWFWQCRVGRQAELGWAAGDENNQVKIRIFMVAREKEARRNIKGEVRRKAKTNIKGKGEKAVEERENRGKIRKT